MTPEPQPAPDFRAIFEAYPTAILVLTPELVIEAANQAWFAVTMTRREDVVGRPFFEVFPDNPDEPSGNVARMRASLVHVLKTGRADAMAALRHDIRDPSGRFTLRWWLPLNFPVLAPDGMVRHIVHAVKDVTAEVRAGQEARAAREREAYIVADAEDYAIMTMDVDRRVTSWSPAAATTFGYSESEALGLSTDELFTPEDRAAGAPAREAEQSRRDGRAPDHGWRLRKDGSRVFVRGSTRPLYAPDGALTGYLKIARDETRERAFVDALRASEAHFRTLADTMPVLVSEADAAGLVTYTNHRFQNFTGLSAEALAGEGWVQAIHPDDVVDALERWKAALGSGHTFEAEIRLRARSGEHRWFLVRATPVRDAGGVVRGWFGAGSDVDEQHRASDRQALLNKEISHRVKNSLQLVSGFLSLQARRAPETTRSLIEQAAGRVRAVAQVHDQLWRRNAADTIPLAPFLTDLCESLSQAAPHLTTTWSFEPASTPVDAAAPIGLVVNEILTNAYKYAFPLGREGAVEVKGTREEGRYRIEIRDWGVGLPQDFDLARPGESLGMRVVNALADQLGAEIRAENAEPGARFILVAPL